MIDFAACAAASPELNFQWSGNRCRIMLTNTGDAPRRFGEVVLFAGTPGCPASTRFYGEGYSMLSQYQGTLEPDPLLRRRALPAAGEGGLFQLLQSVAAVSGRGTGATGRIQFLPPLQREIPFQPGAV